MKRLLLGLLALLLASATGAVVSASWLAGAPSAPTAVVVREDVPITRALPEPPPRDLYALAERLRTGGRPVPRQLEVLPEQLGDVRTFWVTEVSTGSHYQVEAVLRAATPRLALYVQRGLQPAEDDLRRSAEAFETAVLPCVRQQFGSELPAGEDATARLAVLVGNFPGVAGYYSSADEYPTAVNPFSNQRKMFYLNAGALRLGSNQFLSTLAHEFFHMVQWANDPTEATWVNEGLAELAAERCGAGASFLNAFLANPNTSLTGWAASPAAAGPHYGAAYLFFRYLAQRFGSDTLPDLVREPRQGVAGVAAWLARHGGPSFETVFKDWTVANLLNDPTQPRYRHDGLNARVAPRTTISQFGSVSGSVQQFGAQYYELHLPADATIRFEGEPTVALLGAEPRPGHQFWWSTRGDGMDATLTREVDLRGVERATLEFSLWHDLERNWDFAYVAVSVDGGTSWQVLPATTSTSAVDSAFGPGWTGSSGGSQPSWVPERVDLSAYAGQRILLRFEVVTDDAINLEGLALDNLRIPEIGWADDAEEYRGWTAVGFVRTAGRFPQRFAVQLVRFGPTVTVEDLVLDAQNRGSLTLRGVGQDVQRAVLIVSGLTAETSREGAFRLLIEPAERR
ncbi:MAG: immune inhibitor A [Chloroflexi bacterium]|nr:immune inhibitor A [Chloroflexota bacterium]